MQILENVGKNIKDDTKVILMISYKEARIFNDAMEAYVKANKRKVIAKNLFKQMYDTLPY